MAVTPKARLTNALVSAYRYIGTDLCRCQGNETCARCTLMAKLADAQEILLDVEVRT